MKFPSFKKWQIITAIVLIALIFTNPSQKEYQEYHSGHRVADFFIFSIYTDNTDVDKGYCLGIAHNYIVFPKKEIVRLDSVSVTDNAIYDDSVNLKRSADLAATNTANKQTIFKASYAAARMKLNDKKWSEWFNSYDNRNKVLLNGDVSIVTIIYEKDVNSFNILSTESDIDTTHTKTFGDIKWTCINTKDSSDYAIIGWHHTKTESVFTFVNPQLEMIYHSPYEK